MSNPTKNSSNRNIEDRHIATQKVKEILARKAHNRNERKAHNRNEQPHALRARPSSALADGARRCRGTNPDLIQHISLHTAFECKTYTKDELQKGTLDISQPYPRCIKPYAQLGLALGGQYCYIFFQRKDPRITVWGASSRAMDLLCACGEFRRLPIFKTWCESSGYPPCTRSRVLVSMKNIGSLVSLGSRV